MITHTTVAALRAQVGDWRRQGRRIGFVPTMGNLHAGHFALVDLAKQHADHVVASIFVNPTQFGPNEDYARYPRTPDSDIEGLRSHGCDALLLPSVEEMYPFGTIGCVQMHVPNITDILCGAHRPGHFNGVAQVVARLFNMVQPDVAVRRARVQRVVLVRAELGRVDEDAGHDVVGVLAREVHQREMAGMQVAHGRHEADAQALAAPVADLRAQPVDGGVRDHW